MTRAVVGCAIAVGMTLASTSFAQVVVNEVHYRPARSAVSMGEDPSRLQFVELFNAGVSAVDLSGWSIASAARLSFPEGTSIAPSGYLVVAADPVFLREHEPSIPADVNVIAWAEGDLARGRVQLLDGAQPNASVVDDVAFSGDGTWPTKANGEGSSLELVNPRLGIGGVRAWRASVGANGTPGAANSRLGEPIVIEEIPTRATSAAGLREISITFSEEMKHILASDLTVDGAPATGVTGNGAGPYVFAVRPLGPGTVSVALRGNVLESRESRVFSGDAWQYFTPPTTILSMPHDANGGSGAVVQVPVSAAPADGILGIDMTLQYDPAVVQAQDMTVSGIAASAGFALVRNLNTPGIIIVSTYATQDALVGSGEIARIQFHVVGSPGAASTLTFTSASLNEGGIPVGFDPGLFTVTCAGAVNGTACNDGDPCTINDACSAGTCVGSPITAPPETQNVRVQADKASYIWDPMPNTPHYDVVRGGLVALPVGPGGGDEVCFDDLVAAVLVDASIPTPGAGFWYLSRAESACGIGTFGFRGVHGVPGAERTTSTCP